MFMQKKDMPTDLFNIGINDPAILQQILDTASITVAAESLSKLQYSFESITTADISNPLIVNSYQTRINEIRGLLNMPDEVNLTEVSTEGVKDVFLTVISKIADFIASVVNFFIRLGSALFSNAKTQSGFAMSAASSAKQKANTIKKNGYSGPTSQQSSSGTKTSTPSSPRSTSTNKPSSSGSSNNTSKTTSVNDVKFTHVTINLPLKALVMFHSSKHKPETSFKYNGQGLEKGIEAITRDIDTFTDGVTTDLEGLIAVTSHIVKHAFDDTALQGMNIRGLYTKKVLDGLYHNNFTFIGCGIVQKPMRNVSEFKDYKYDIVNLVGDYGWANDATFELTVKIDDIPSLVDKMTAQIDSANRKALGVIELLNRSKITKSLENTKQYLSAVSAADDSAQQQRTLRAVNVAGELAGAATLIANSYKGFIQRYTSVLTGTIVELNKAL